MIKKGYRLYSILHYKCPFCHEGDFYDGKYLNSTVKNCCDKCGEKFSKEPGFYQGSYYVTYALGVAIFVTLWVSQQLWLPNLPVGWTIGIIITTIALSTPITYPLSKIIWANFFYSYKQKD